MFSLVEILSRVTRQAINSEEEAGEEEAAKCDSDHDYTNGCFAGLLQIVFVEMAVDSQVCLEGLHSSLY